MRLKALLQALEDFDGLLDRRLRHVNFLETARQRMVLFEDTAVFLIGGGADALERTTGQRRFEQVGGVHGAAGCRTGTNQRVNFVDEQDRLLGVGQFLEYGFQALLEVTTVFGAGQQ